VAASSATWRWSSATAGKPSGAEMRNHASRTVASKLPGSMTLTRSETGKAIVENMLIVQPWLASFLCEGLGNRCTGSALLTGRWLDCSMSWLSKIHKLCYRNILQQFTLFVPLDSDRQTEMGLPSFPIAPILSGHGGTRVCVVEKPGTTCCPTALPRIAGRVLRSMGDLTWPY